MANGWLCILKNTRKNGLQQKSKDVGSVKKQSKTWLVLIIVCMAAVLFMGFLVYRHNDEPQMHEISVMENRKDELVFDVSLDEYIEQFNRYYRADYRKDYLLPMAEWYSETYSQGIHSRYETVCYDFSEDPTMWTLPTITAYVPSDCDAIQEITVNFDDHGYREDMYTLYGELCFYTVKVFFPELDNRTITWLCKTLNNYAYQNLLPYEQGYSSDSVPAVLYYQNGAGIYPYFATGESMHLCIIPVTDETLQVFADKGTEIHNLSVQSSESENVHSEEEVLMSDDEQKRVETVCRTVTEICEPEYRNACWEPSAYMPDQNVMTQESIDAMEQRLIAEGYAVLDSDSRYPAFLQNAEGFSAFWKAVQNGKTAQQDYLWISPYGGMHYASMENREDGAYYLEAVVKWNEQHKMMITELYKRDVLDWELTENGNFYYKLYEAHSPAFEDYTMLRLEKPDYALWDLTIAYLNPVGYQSNNLFSCEWSAEDYGTLCFNDLLEFLYREQSGQILDPTVLSCQEKPFYYQIPAETFESSILPYFSISLQQLRERSCYDSKTGTYPWLDVAYDNLSYFPLITPEVKTCRQNTDGSFTLTVDAMCIGLKTDSLFRHEVRIRPGDSEAFQYMGNHLIKVSDELPAYVPRLEMQRKGTV